MRPDEQMTLEERAKAANQFLYSYFGHGHITKTAAAIGMSREHASQILNGNDGFLNETGMQRVEAFVASLQASETDTFAAAA